MEKLKCRFLLLFALLLLLASIFTTKDASAVSFGSMREYYVSEGGLGYPIDDSHTQSIVNFSRAGNDVWASINGTQVAQWTQMHLQLNNTIPANSLVSFNVTYKGTSDTSPTPVWFYNGLQLDYDRFLISQECTSINGSRVYASGTFTQMTCNYLAYFPQASSIIDSAYYSHIIEVAGVQTVDSVMTVVVGPVSSIQANFDSLTTSDRQWLEEHMPSGSSPADIKSAIESAKDDEKSEYEEQADETENTANDESSAAQSTATSLLSVVGQFIGVLSSAQPTNCNLNGNLIPHLPLGTLNLCQNDPPTAIVVLGSLLLIAFVVPLAYHTVKRMINLIGSFQN